MNSISTLCRRHRRLLLAAGYLLVLVFAVMYLRVTISVPPEGDDKLTLNKWLYDFNRMPFWQYLLQDLGQRLRYFTLQEVRFFPFHYPSAFSLLFFGSLLRQLLRLLVCRHDAVEVHHAHEQNDREHGEQYLVSHREVKAQIHTSAPQSATTNRSVNSMGSPFPGSCGRPE